MASSAAAPLGEFLSRLGLGLDTPAERLYTALAAAALAVTAWLLYTVATNMAIMMHRKSVLAPMPKAPGWFPLVRARAAGRRWRRRVATRGPLERFLSQPAIMTPNY